MARKRRLTGEAALNAAYGKSDHAPLLEAWGVDLPDDLLRLALTHRSFANENGHLPNNERLEFLGDAVLGLAVAEQLYRQFPERAESDISKMRSGVVNMYALADVARHLGMGDYILLGRGEMLTGGKDKHSILADSVESMLGAIYLHHGFDVARATVLRLFAEKITEAPTTGLTMDWKTVLLEKLSDMKLPLPTYEVRGEGPEHDKTFYATVTIEDLVTHGEGHTKKVAEHAAAKQAVQKLNERA
ncbi:ribonuclease III [Corynebacterium jeikeium]|uniref:ribonuclease III n=1 Tax=Corynebacterium jeikeium TaxID=38289 RepID=UPI0001B71625|nr:ribonuclease III [Corynebacterium jeikeium]EEW16124.1 ribonuclease III [Corynebacterium jeikeium ATCC 43734]OOD34416.1 ribonuclease III [Corynebacterium jeikeium]WCZ53755.1 Ribonuclease 3 [Corynebacterium jeikeium]SCX17370.1 Ribonuclease 3 [Corynebacterium jeikeium]SQI20663.1 ribonuclease III [Corynebacterium jeikeium]